MLYVTPNITPPSSALFPINVTLEFLSHKIKDLLNGLKYKGPPR